MHDKDVPLLCNPKQDYKNRKPTEEMAGWLGGKIIISKQFGPSQLI